jgi:hypothetical protein
MSLDDGLDQTQPRPSPRPVRLISSIQPLKMRQLVGWNANAGIANAKDTATAVGWDLTSA